MLLLPHVQPEMLHPDTWLARALQPDVALMTAGEIAAFNARVAETQGLPDVLDLPEVLPAAEVRARMAPVPESARYGVDGAPIPAAVWDGLRAELALDALPDPAPVRFGLVTRYTPLRALPTDRAALRTPGDLPFDRLQESTLDTGWPVAILHTTHAGDWHFGLTPGYWGWVRAAHVAECDRTVARTFARAEPVLMVQAAWGGIALAGEGLEGELPYATAGMATCLPLLGEADGLRRVQIPRRAADGRLILAEGYVASADPEWRGGRLPLTTRSVITQAFRALGEPYAWGGLRLARPGRDCSRLVWDAWAAAGVFLPRNSGAQGRVGVTAVTFDPGDSTVTRLQKLRDHVPPGALLLLAGHVMLYLGMLDGIPYAIHDLWNYAQPDGTTLHAGQVVVSALPPEPSAARHTLLERLTHAQLVAPF